MTELDSILEQVLAPAREKISELEAEIEGLETQLAAKREELRPYRRVVNAAARSNGKPGPKPTPKKAEAQLDEVGPEIVERVEKEIRERWLGNEFTATDVHRDFQPAGDRPGVTKVTAACRYLWSAGVLRKVRRGRGGSTIYRLVT